MKKLAYILAALLCICQLVGCTVEEGETERLAEPDYTVVVQEDLPSALLEQIETNKQQEMKLSYSDGDAFYIVRGYGEQPSGSSIQVLDLYETKNGIVFDTQLVGSGEAGDETAYPYVVVKLLCDEQNVVFE